MIPIREHLLETFLARGATSEVWAATRVGPNGFAVPVALKTLSAPYASSPEHVEAFLNEARIASYVQHHNVVQTRELLLEDGRYWLGMELVRGWSVRTLLSAVEASGEAIPIPVAIALARDAAAGLEAIHGAGLVHRNITPDNLMIAAAGHLVVLDFGCAAWQLAERVRFTPPPVPLDPTYASPEIRAHLPVDARTDVWSLGALLRRLLPRRADIPLGLEGVITRAQSPDSARRFPSARGLEIALDLVSIREGWLLTPSYVAAYLSDVLHALPARRPPARRPPQPTADGSLVMPLRERERPRVGLVGVGARPEAPRTPPDPPPLLRRPPTRLGKTRVRVVRH